MPSNWYMHEYSTTMQQTSGFEDILDIASMIYQSTQVGFDANLRQTTQFQYNMLNTGIYL